MTAPPELAEGASQLGEYALLERLGTGTRGAVYRAFDGALRREVALKVFDGPGDGTGASRDDVRAVAALDHPGLLTVYAVGHADGRDFIAMELAEQTLKAWLEQDNRSARDIAGQFAHLASGLAAAHAAGLVHGNITTSSILIGRDGAARLSDFGGAFAATHSLEDVEPPSPEADQRALAGALFEALYGQRPGLKHPVEVPAKGRSTRVPRWLRADVRRGLRAAFDSLEGFAAALRRGMHRRRRVWSAMGLGVGLSSAVVAGWAFRAPSGPAKPLERRTCEQQAHDRLDAHGVRAVGARLLEDIADGPRYRVELARATQGELQLAENAWLGAWADACNGAPAMLETPLYSPATRCLDDRLKTLVEVDRQARIAGVQDADRLARNLAETLDPSACLGDLHAKRDSTFVGEPEAPRLRRARAMLLRGALEEAEAAAEEIVREAGRDPLFVAASSTLAETLLAQESYAEAIGVAEPGFLVALELGQDSAASDLAAVLASAHAASSRTTARSSWAQLAVSLSARSGRDRRQHAVALSVLAQETLVQGETDEAVALCDAAAALALEERVASAAQEGVRRRCVRVWLDGGGLERARLELQQLLDGVTARYGDQHPVVADTLRQKMRVELHSNDADAAYKTARQVLQLREDAFGPEDPRVISALVNVGGTANMAGETEAGLLAIRKAASIAEDTQTPSDIRYEEANCLAARLEGAVNCDSDATEGFVRRCEAAVEALEAGSPATRTLAVAGAAVGGRSYLADVYRCREDDTNLTRIVEGMQPYLQAENTSHARWMVTAAALAALRAEQGRHAEAVELLERVLLETSNRDTGAARRSGWFEALTRSQLALGEARAAYETAVLGQKVLEQAEPHPVIEERRAFFESVPPASAQDAAGHQESSF